MIQLQHLYKQIAPGFSVQGLCLEIARGEALALFGPSGCGKTTTLRLIAGFELPDEGTITINGRLASTPRKSLPPHARNLGMVFQDLALWPHMRVAQHLRFVLKGRLKDKAKIASKIEQILDKTQLQNKADAFPHQLSGGQRQRLALARALVIDPEILLMDEPLSSLDAHLRSLLLQDIRNLVKACGISTVFATHDLQEAIYLADRIAFMQSGRIGEIVESKSVSGAAIRQPEWVPNQLQFTENPDHRKVLCKQ